MADTKPNARQKGRETATPVRVKNPSPAPPAPRPTHQRIKADGTKIGRIRRATPAQPVGGDAAS